MPINDLSSSSGTFNLTTSSLAPSYGFYERTISLNERGNERGDDWQEPKFPPEVEIQEWDNLEEALGAEPDDGKFSWLLSRFESFVQALNRATSLPGAEALQAQGSQEKSFSSFFRGIKDKIAVEKSTDKLRENVLKSFEKSCQKAIEEGGRKDEIEYVLRNAKIRIVNNDRQSQQTFYKPDDNTIYIARHFDLDAQGKAPAYDQYVIRHEFKHAFDILTRTFQDLDNCIKDVGKFTNFLYDCLTESVEGKAKEGDSCSEAKGLVDKFLSHAQYYKTASSPEVDLYGKMISAGLQRDKGAKFNVKLTKSHDTLYKIELVKVTDSKGKSRKPTKDEVNLFNAIINVDLKHQDYERAYSQRSEKPKTKNESSLKEYYQNLIHFKYLEGSAFINSALNEDIVRKICGKNYQEGQKLPKDLEVQLDEIFQPSAAAEGSFDKRRDNIKITVPPFDKEPQTTQVVKKFPVPKKSPSASTQHPVDLARAAQALMEHTEL